MVVDRLPSARTQDMWWRLLTRWLITAIAIAIAILVVPGIQLFGGNAVAAIVVTAALLGLANAVVRPLLQFLSCGCIVATLGLFVLVINAIVLLMAGWISDNVFRTGFHIDGFWPAFWGAIVISVVSFMLSVFLPDPAPEDD
jgi:putative membrane protein